MRMVRLREQRTLRDLRSHSTGSVRASLTIASEPFDYPYTDPLTEGTHHMECRLYRSLSLYANADYLLEELWVKGQLSENKSVDLYFTSQYFADMDIGYFPKEYQFPGIPDWFAVGRPYDLLEAPHPGYGFATDVHTASFTHPHPDFPDKSKDYRTFSWSLQPSKAAKCLHLFMWGNPGGFDDRAGQYWYELIYKSLKASLKRIAKKIHSAIKKESQMSDKEKLAKTESDLAKQEVIDLKLDKSSPSNFPRVKSEITQTPKKSAQLFLEKATASTDPKEASEWLFIYDRLAKTIEKSEQTKFLNNMTVTLFLTGVAIGTAGVVLEIIPVIIVGQFLLGASVFKIVPDYVSEFIDIFGQNKNILDVSQKIRVQEVSNVPQRIRLGKKSSERMSQTRLQLSSKLERV